MSIDEHLEGWPVRCQAPVAWGQMDAFGHVNNTVYLRWFEDARIAVFERVGWLDVMQQTGVGPILARTQCVFKRPVTWPDRITVAARVDDLGADRFTMLYRVISHDSGEIVAEGDARLVSFDYRAGTKAPLPPSVRTALLTL